MTPLAAPKRSCPCPGAQKGGGPSEKVPKTEGGKSISLEFLKTPPLSLYVSMLYEP